ncbi:helix-turn-helix transcriptional regulator [Vibrio aestuarianus]|uniref:Helix-turn-helix domain-containing protein n=2 Tax=Vibrio aestuarianus TaxID=28171 RepID=A0A9X4EYF0_9VIBR|nr:helix-turn-helix domain-containing protein [Vibrio aestuarianus]MDE1243816.1 helix-turn-helix domain-containing protein [Vibrio aestuarianus]
MVISIGEILSSIVGNPAEFNALIFNDDAEFAPSSEALNSDVCHSLLLIMCGSAEICDENSGVLLSRIHAGTICYFPYTSIINLDLADNSKAIVIKIKPQDIELSLIKMEEGDMNFIEKKNLKRRGPRVSSCILQSLQEQTMQSVDKDTSRLLIISLISSVLFLLRNPLSEIPRRKSLIDEIKSYINDNYREFISRDTIANQFFISSAYLSKIFQDEEKIGFNKYVISVRIENAKFMLKDNTIKIKDVARLSGFSDANYFCKIFKEKTRRSPSEYREHYLSVSKDNC